MIDFWEHRKKQIVEEYRTAWKQRSSAPIMNNVKERWEELAKEQVEREKIEDMSPYPLMVKTHVQ